MVNVVEAVQGGKLNYGTKMESDKILKVQTCMLIYHEYSCVLTLFCIAQRTGLLLQDGYLALPRMTNMESFSLLVLDTSRWLETSSLIPL